MNRELSILGLAKRAGRLAVGNDAVSEALRTGRAKLLLLAEDAAENTVRRFGNRRQDVPFETLPCSKETLGAAIGYQNCAVAAICDAGFVKAFRQASAASPSFSSAGHSDKQPKDQKIT